MDAVDGKAHLIEARSPFRDDSGARFVVAGDDGFFASGNPFEKLAKATFRVKGGDGGPAKSEFDATWSGLTGIVDASNRVRV